MVNIIDYIFLSESADSIKSPLTSAANFSEKFHTLWESEKPSYLRHYIINNVPYLFNTKPLLFEQIVQYLADKIKIPPSEIKLIGSAKTGFAISNPDYGKPFSPSSDLDFSIISEKLFNSLKEEFQYWATLYEKKEINAPNNRQKLFWDGNAVSVPKQIKNGHIDSYKIPNYNQFPMAKSLNNSLSLVVLNLKSHHDIEVKKASARVYKSWQTFEAQIRRNTSAVLGSL